nr:hypothetical protein [Tanacetum cinerariifolium]
FTEAAAVLGAVELQVVAQHQQQRCVGHGRAGHRLAIDRAADAGGGRAREGFVHVSALHS